MTTALSQLITEAEAAELLCIKPQTLAAWRCRATQDLPFVRVGRAIRYRLSDVEDWLARRTQTATARAAN